jgi:hypothetical protein
MQREAVEQVLRGCLADHMAKAAMANIARSSAAHSEYSIADAFKAAIEALQFDDADEDHIALPQTEPLKAVTSPLDATDSDVRTPEKRAKLTDTVVSFVRRTKANARKSKSMKGG